MRFEVNLSDFCIYYQQPTNNTPELALRIGYMQQNLPHLLLLAYSAVAFSCLLDYLAPYFRGCRCSDIAAARSYAYVCIRHSCDECPQQPPHQRRPSLPCSPPHQRRPSLPCSPRSSLVHRTTIARSSPVHRTTIARSSPVHRSFIAPASRVHRPYIALSLHVQPTYSTRSSYVFLRVNYVRTVSSRVCIVFTRARVSLNIIN